jgi:hypothetical protein
MKINLKPILATPSIMEGLEKKGIITRLRPGAHELQANKGVSTHKSLYESDDKFGPHKLITVTINSCHPERFLYHNDNEDFMILDHLDREALVITIAVDHYDLLNQKIKNKTLSSSDFISLILEPNNPEISFFTMHKGYAHVETCLLESEKPPSFYVSECRDLDENFIDFKTYQLDIEV